MTRLTPILLGLTFVMSVVTMVLVLLLFVTKPWDDAITEAELSEILQAEQETSSEEKEAERVAKCESLGKFAELGLEVNKEGMPDAVFPIWFEAIIENNCWPSK